MSDRQGWVGRLGGRATSTSQQPPSGPEPGNGRPVRSNGPGPGAGRGPLPGPGPRGRQPVPGPEGPALRVVLMSRDNMLAGALRSLVEAPGGVRMLDWYSQDLDSVIRHADVVIVDTPPALHERTFAVLAGRFLGRTVVLLQEGEHAEALPPGSSRAVLYRPLQIGELWSAVTGASDLPVTGEAAEPEAAGPQPSPDPEVDPEPAPSAGPELQPGPEVAADDQTPIDAAAVEVEGQGLPVAESGRLIGLSGQELDPVVGPGQVAPGMDEATFERLRGWKSGPGTRQPAGSRKGRSPGKRRSGARTAAREESLQAQAAQAEASRIAREERQARAEEARQAKAARAGARLAAREESRQAKAARTQERAAARAESRQARATRAEERSTARAESRQARATRAEERSTARAESRQAKAAEAAARRAARAAARQAEAQEAEARRAVQNEARQAEAEARRAARDEARRAEAAAAEERRAARAEARRAKAAQMEARQTEQAEARRVAREESLKAKTAQAEARRAAHEEAVQARAARKDASRQARSAKAAARRATRDEAKEKRAAEGKVRRDQAVQAQTARAEAQKVARAEAAQRRAARDEARKAARDESRQARAARAEERRAANAAAAQARAVQAEARRAARAEAAAKRAAAAEVRRQEDQRGKAAKAEIRAAARAEAGNAKAARAEARKVARGEARQTKAAEAEARKVAQVEARQAKAAEAEARAATRAEAAKERAARAEAQEVVRREAEQARAAQAKELRAAKAARQQEQQAARAEAGRKQAAEAEARREQTQQAKAAKAEARESARAEADKVKAAKAEARAAARAETSRAKAAEAEARAAARGEDRARASEAKVAKAEARKVARQEASQARAAQAEARRTARAEAGQAKAAARDAARAQAAQTKAARAETQAQARAAAEQAKAARAQERRAKADVGLGGGGAGRPVGDGVARVVRPAVVALLVAVLGVAAAGWVGGGGAETRAGEVAVVRAAGGSEGGLVVQDPRVGPIEPLHALGVGVWLRASEARSSLEGVVRQARVPSRFLLGGVAGLTVVLFLLLMRVGPGSGAAAGPGPAPPQQGGRRWRLAGAALAGALVALDPLVVQSGRAATGTVLAVLLAMGTVALAWGVPARPTLRWLPLVAAGGGLALLVSPLALPVLAVPVVAELLQGRYQDAWKDMAALGLAIAMWLLLPVWVAGQGLGAAQAGWLLGRPPGRGSVAASLSGAPLTWLLVAAGVTAAILTWRHRSGARSDDGLGAARLLAWMGTSAAGALVAIAVGYPAEQALPFAVPAAAVSVAVGAGLLLAAAATAQASRAGVVSRWIGVGAGVVLVGLLAGQAVDWNGRYLRPADDGLGRLVATVGAEVPACSAVNASGPDDQARLLAAGVTVTDFSDGPAAQAAGVRYFVLTGGTGRGGPMTPSLAAWVREHGTRLATHPSRSLAGVELWRVDAAPLDPVADLLPLPDGVFSNTSGSACGGYRVVDSQAGSFHTAYRSVGGKAVLGRPLGSVWTSDGPALQAFDTMVLGAVPTAGGPPAVRPIELPPLLAKLDVEAVADADIPLPSATPPVTNRQVRALLHDKLIGRAYLGTDPATASAEDFRRARERFGRPLGLPQMMPDGAIRQPFERVVLELPADGGQVRPAALGRLAVRLGLVPRQAMRLEPVPGLPVRPAETRLDPAPLLRLVGGALALLLLAAGAGTVLAWRSRTARAG